jgi:hypothetical protein
VIATPLVIGAAGVWLRGEYTSQDYSWRNAPAGIDMAALLTGHPFHPVWGAAVGRLHARLGIDPIEGVPDGTRGLSFSRSTPALLSQNDARV